MMELLHTIVAMIREHRWGVILLLLFGTLAACQDIPIDSDTANITRRVGDTIVRYDTTLVRDTIIDIDTVITTKLDTVITIDTVIKVKEVIRRDTITLTDTLKTGDTVVIDRDTLFRYDTVHKRDTLRLYDYEQLEARATLFRIREGRAVDSLPVQVDRVTKVTVPEQPGGRELPWMGLRFVGHVPKNYDSSVWGVPPSMIYLVVQEVALQNNKGKRELFQDPRVDGNNGLAVVPHPPLDGQWMATGRMGEAEYVVTSVDFNNRYIYAYVKATFIDKSVHLDSMAIKLKY